MNKTVAIAMLPPDPMNSLTDGSFTYHLDKYSCMKGMYEAHLIFSDLVGICGLMCIITRMVPQIKWMHKWFGKGYIITMLWASGTSLLIHNTGLPAGVLISFVWVVAGLTIGWLAIGIHQYNLTNAAVKAVQEDIKANGGQMTKDLNVLIDEKKAQIQDEKTWVQRFFSIKTFHACVMFTSFINILGRVFRSDQSGDFSCYTYPVYKPIDTKLFKGANAPLTFVPTHSPNYSSQPWAKTGLTGWGIALSIGPLLGSAVIALVYSIALQSFRKKPTKSNEVDTASLAMPYMASSGVQRPAQLVTIDNSNSPEMDQPLRPMTSVGHG